jgi:hypothetical protein
LVEPTGYLADIARTVVNLRLRLCHASLIGGDRTQQPHQFGEVHRYAPRIVARQPIWSPSEPVGRTLTPNAGAQEPRMTSANQLPTRRLVTSTEPGGIDKIAAALAIAEKLAGTFSACHSLLFRNTFVKFCVCQLSDTPLYLC